MVPLAPHRRRRGRSIPTKRAEGDETGLVAVVDSLWPDGKVRLGGGRAGGAMVTFLALPRPASPSILLPLRPSRATAAVLRAHRAPRSARQRVRHVAMVTMARMGAGHLVPRKVTLLNPTPRPDDGLEAHLGSILEQHVAVGVHLGPPRANRKPIVQAVDRRGKTLAFAKVGTNELTRALVRAETAALQSLENVDLSCLTIPRILHSGAWGDHELLVLGPLDTRNVLRAQPGLLQRAMVELATSRGSVREVVVRSGYWNGLRHRIETLPGPQASPLLEAMVTLEALGNDLRVGLGVWHGDWTPWNMACREGRVVLWDWERFGTGVPVGFDALHFELQSTVRRGRLTLPEAVSALIARADELLGPFGVGRRAVPAVVATYLLEIGARYLQDRQEEAGSRLGDLGGWLLPALPPLVRSVTSKRQA